MKIVVDMVARCAYLLINETENNKQQGDEMYEYPKGQTTYKGKKASWYINRAQVALFEGNPVVLYGSDITLEFTINRQLVLTRGGEVLANLHNVSNKSYCKLFNTLLPGRDRLRVEIYPPLKNLIHRSSGVVTESACNEDGIEEA